MNDLTLWFGPTMVDSDADIGIAFLSGPATEPDVSIGILSSERYARENYPHRREYSTTVVTNDTTPTSADGYPTCTVEGYFPGVGGNAAKTWAGATVECPSNIVRWNVLNSPITVAGIRQTASGHWFPIVKPGVVVRSHVIQDTEPAGSWLRQAWADHIVEYSSNSSEASGALVYLVYAVPEIRYGSAGSLSSFPTGRARSLEEHGVVVGPRTIGYTDDIHLLTGIAINGTAAGTGIVVDIDERYRKIDVSTSLKPDDEVVLTYLRYEDAYVYRGYRSGTQWYPLDLNPEYGHFTMNASGTMLASADALLQQITLYCIPSAVLIVETTAATGATRPIVDFRFYSALDYGETHFIRHLTGLEAEEIVFNVTESAVNTWGNALLGVNYYDQPVTQMSDVFSTTVPTMMPLGRFILGASASADAVAAGDIRRRGGGLPESVSRRGLTQPSVRDYVMGFFDVGTWDGPAIHEGGVLDIRVDSSVLDEFTEAEVREIVESEMMPGIGWRLLFT